MATNYGPSGKVIPSEAHLTDDEVWVVDHEGRVHKIVNLGDEPCQT